MHWAAHRHTAAEIVYQRADVEKENMGLTSWEGKRIKRSDTEIAKNYLTQTELDLLLILKTRNPLKSFIITKSPADFISVK